LTDMKQVVGKVGRIQKETLQLKASDELYASSCNVISFIANVQL